MKNIKRKHSKKNFLIISGILIAVFVMTVMSIHFVKTIFSSGSIQRTVSIETINRINYNENDEVFVAEQQIKIGNNIASFWIIKSEGEVELFRINYTETYEEIKYRKHDKYIYFWFNGIGNEVEELNINTPNKELRIDTDAILYKYNIETAEYTRVDIDKPKQTVIIDVLINNGEELIIKEIATKRKGEIWSEMKTIVGQKEYLFPVTNCYSFEGKSVVFKNQLIMPTYKDIVIINNKEVHEKIEYPVSNPYHTNLYVYNDKLISVVNATHITIYNSAFEILEEFIVEEEYQNSIIIDNKIILYGVSDGKAFVGAIDLANYEFSKIGEEQHNKNLHGHHIKIRYNRYERIVELYDVENLDIYIRVEL